MLHRISRSAREFLPRDSSDKFSRFLFVSSIAQFRFLRQLINYERFFPQNRNFSRDLFSIHSIHANRRARGARAKTVRTEKMSTADRRAKNVPKQTWSASEIEHVFGNDMNLSLVPIHRTERVIAWAIWSYCVIAIVLFYS